MRESRGPMDEERRLEERSTGRQFSKIEQKSTMGGYADGKEADDESGGDGWL